MPKEHANGANAIDALGKAEGVDLEFLCNSGSCDTRGSGGSCNGLLEPTLVM